MIRTLPMIVACVAMPFAVLAAGSDTTEPPTKTNTTEECKDGQVWDEKTKTCVDAVEGRLDDETLFQAAREFAYDGQYDATLAVLAAMSEGDTDRVLTYKGFANRKAGRIEEGMAYYQAALARNPDNVLARSYLGQGLVDQGELELASVQLAEIVARGGDGTWAEVSLRHAIDSGETASY